MSHSVIGEADEDHAGVSPLKFPSQLMPGERSRRGAGNCGVDPPGGRIAVNVPDAAIFDVALRAKDEFVRLVRLVHVEFERLRSLWIGQVEADVVSEVPDSAVCSQLLPPQCVGVGSAAADIEFGRGAIERGREHVFSH